MGETFSCLGNNEPSIKNVTDVKIFSRKEENEEIRINELLLVNAGEAVSMQSAMRGFLARKNIKGPLSDIQKTRKWFKIEDYYEVSEKPVHEIQNTVISDIEKKLSPIKMKKLDDGVEVKANPAVKLKDGSVYEGEWDKKGNRHGNGTLIMSDGSKVTGFFNKDVLEGWGRMIQTSGVLYEGQFKDGKLNGAGKVKGKHGGIFEGQLLDGKPHGYGVEEWPDGMKYEGNYVHGKREGNGTLTLGDGSVYNGGFYQDKMHGFGEYKWKNGNKYIGEWVDNKMHGKGKFEWPNGRLYEGEFNNDLKCGQGKIVWPDGREYDGEWLDGKQHGNGLYKFIKGNDFVTKKGVWENGSRKEWLK